MNICSKIVDNSIEIIRVTRIYNESCKENCRRRMGPWSKLKWDKFLTKVIVFFRKCDCFLCLVYRFYFDGKMIWNIRKFLAKYIRTLTKYTFGCNSPIILEKYSSLGLIFDENRQFRGRIRNDTEFILWPKKDFNVMLLLNLSTKIKSVAQVTSNIIFTSLGWFNLLL